MNQCLFSVLNHPDWNIKTSMYIIHGIIPPFSAVLYFYYILAEKLIDYLFSLPLLCIFDIERILLCYICRNCKKILYNYCLYI